MKTRKGEVSDVLVVVISYNSALYLERCLDSVRSNSCALKIIVWDNASSDESVAVALAHPTRPEIIRSSWNEGFGRAVNRAAHAKTFDYLLMLNPDAVLAPGAIDGLMATAELFPNAGLYGGTWTDDNGHPSRRSFLPKPDLIHAVKFALCADFFRRTAEFASTLRKRKQLRGPHFVPALEGSLLMVTASAWHRLGGFDESFFLYGEDVDLCMRASKLGYRPVCMHDVRYYHARGASSSNQTVRQKMVLQALTILHRRYSIGWLCDRLLMLGVLIRAIAEGLSRTDRKWRRCWRERGEWLDTSQEKW